MSQTSPGRSMKFDLGAAGKSVGSWFNEKAVPYLRDTFAPAILNTIDSSLGSTYTEAKDAVLAGKDWTDVVGGVADGLTEGVGKKAADLVGLGAPYQQASNLVKKGKDITGITTAGFLKGISNLVSGKKRSAEETMVPGKRMRF